ncbi:hypothetical protein HK100_007319 [Physocladia obscura]|uniref:phenylalanine 4-monooxygenase n=1 Tax=Physocladia obscura TaxID=109957 RepID=A0AAD5T5S5_9FUNG|nr:hypothetical protein HK100_007319 [Physocladia obscura]
MHLLRSSKAALGRVSSIRPIAPSNFGAPTATASFAMMRRVGKANNSTTTSGHLNAARMQSTQSSQSAKSVETSHGPMGRVVPAELSETFKTSLFFTVKDRVGALDDVLGQIRSLHISLTRIESRPSKTNGSYDFFIDFDAQSRLQSDQIIEKFKTLSLVESINIITGHESEHKDASSSVPWFPRKASDIDAFVDHTITYGAELDADHPGFQDAEYRTRRAEIASIAQRFRHGDRCPDVKYSDDEVKAWGIVFNKLTKLYETHACKEHRFMFPLLIQNCGFNERNIPQISEVSKFMKECTGWTVRPVAGLLSSRDFFNAFAFRVFHSTQYIRHHSVPLYTPEPDVCHEILGHIPLYCDPDFADFAHELGLASLGASDADLEKLSRIYWYTVEFGLLKEGEQLKAYGAGLLSSFGELEYCIDSPVPKRLPFDPEVCATTPFPPQQLMSSFPTNRITQYQEVYYVVDSFKDMKERVKTYFESFKRPFEVRYNPYTETIEVLDNKDKILKYANTIRGDLSRLTEALDKVIR